MKRTLQFKTIDNGYALFDNDEIVFTIASDNLQFDVKEFYYAFYADEKSSDDIELVNTVESDNNARRVFECIDGFMNSIKDKLDEMDKQELLEDESGD